MEGWKESENEGKGTAREGKEKELGKGKEEWEGNGMMEGGMEGRMVKVR